jgi:UDP-N-acetylglucosamine 4,6-dehydratase/UDP-glucose 4-epimerase
MLDNKKILITGGTGSLGQALTKKLLKTDVDTIRIFSRNESKQVEMESEFQDKKLRFLIGDIRDKERLITAFEDVDIVFHAAALKHVPVIEYNPFESIKTNVVGSQNVIDAALIQNVEKVICIGTDKAVSPLNTYGATKLLMEKLFISANNYMNREKHKTKFIAVRYGHVLGSLNATEIGQGSEIFIPKLKSYEMSTLVKALSELLGEVKQEVTGIRPGEKLHEILINNDEIRYTWNISNMYMLSNPHYELFNTNNISEIYDDIDKVENLNAYSSDIAEKITTEELKEKIKNSNLL